MIEQTKKSDSVLIVEDNPEILTHLANTIRKMGVHVYTATCGKEALNKINQIPVCDVIITDYRMAPVNGADFLRGVIDARSIYPRLAVIHTGESDCHPDIVEILLEANRHFRTVYVEKAGLKLDSILKSIFQESDGELP